MLIHLNILANTILELYFTTSRCLLIFNDNPNFNYQGNLSVVSVEVINGTFESEPIFRYHGCQGIIINAAHPLTVLTNLEYEIRHNMDRFNHRKYLFLPPDILEEDMLDIFNLPELNFIADLLVVYPDLLNVDIWGLEGNVKFKLFTHPFNGENESVLIDEWDSGEGFLHGNYLYPDKLHDGKGRTFKIATFSYKPYSVPSANEGTELQLSLEFCKKYNLTPYLVVDEEGEWGEIFDNWTGYGILGNVMYDNADVGLGALYTWGHEYLFLDLSKPAVRTGITCLAPAPRLAGGWLVPFFPFSHEMWLAVGISFVICSIALFFLELYKIKAKMYRRGAKIMKPTDDVFEESVLSTAGVFLLQSLPEKEEVKHGFAKYLYACMFIFSLLVASSYSSGLASSMTVPRYVGAIKTVQDLVDSGVNWGATSNAWIMSIWDAPEYNYVTLVQRFFIRSIDKLKQFNNKRFAFSVERLPAGYFAIGDYVTEEGVADLRLMTEDLYWEQCVLMTKKSSVWMPILDDYILRLAQTGISNVWEYRVATIHLNAKVQNAVKYSIQHEEQNTQPIKLRWSHVEGTFSIWSMLMILSTICFIIELLVSKWQKRNM